MPDQMVAAGLQAGHTDRPAGQVQGALRYLVTRQLALWAPQAESRLQARHAQTPVRLSWTGLGPAQRHWLTPDLTESLNAEIFGWRHTPQGDSGREDDTWVCQPRSARWVVVRGPLGSGKSELITRFMLCWLERAAALVTQADRMPPWLGPVPIWLDTESWNPLNTSFMSWLADQVQRQHPGIEHFGEDVLLELLDSGKILPFLDGLDEMGDVLLGAALESLRLDAGHVRVVLTLDTPLDLDDAFVIRMLPITAEVAADYLISQSEGGLAQVPTQATAPGEAPRPTGPVAPELSAALALALAGDGHPDDLLALAETVRTQGVRKSVLDAQAQSEQARHALLARWVERTFEDDAQRYWMGWLASALGRTHEIRWWTIADLVPGTRALLGLSWSVGCGIAGAALGGAANAAVSGFVWGAVLGGVAGTLAGRSHHRQPRFGTPSRDLERERTHAVGAGVRGGFAAALVALGGTFLLVGWQQALLNAALCAVIAAGLGMLSTVAGRLWLAEMAAWAGHIVQALRGGGPGRRRPQFVALLTRAQEQRRLELSDCVWRFAHAELHRGWVEDFLRRK